MKKKIFKNTILIILLLVVLCGASIIGVLYNYFNKQYVTSLDQAAGYIAEGVDLAGMDFLTNLNEMEQYFTTTKPISVQWKTTKTVPRSSRQ